MYLIDTYAFLEWFVEGSMDYAPYFEEIEKRTAYTTQLVMLELYHRIYHKKGKQQADFIYSQVRNYFEIIPLDDHIIKEAGIFRSRMLESSKKLSYADCVNYVSAKKLGVKLLTGDEDFAGMENVEFVK